MAKLLRLKGDNQTKERFKGNCWFLIFLNVYIVQKSECECEKACLKQWNDLHSLAGVTMPHL